MKDIHLTPDSWKKQEPAKALGSGFVSHIIAPNGLTPNQMVATVFGHSKTETEGNASVIAAAPDMINLCLAYCKHYQSLKNAQTFEDFQEVIRSEKELYEDTRDLIKRTISWIPDFLKEKDEQDKLSSYEFIFQRGENFVHDQRAVDIVKNIPAEIRISRNKTIDYLIDQLCLIRGEGLNAVTLALAKPTINFLEHMVYGAMATKIWPPLLMPYATIPVNQTPTKP